MTHKKKLCGICLLLLLLAFCLLSSCGSVGSEPPIAEEGPAGAAAPEMDETLPDTEAETEAEAEAVTTIEALLPEENQDIYIMANHSDFPIHHRLEDMQNNEPIIVVGRFLREVELWNASRDPEDIQQPSQEYETPSKIYRFQVQSVLQGSSLPEEISVTLLYSRKQEGQISNEKRDEEGNLLQEATAWDKYSFYGRYGFFTEPELNQPMLIFLDYSPDLDVYYSAGEPFMIALLPEDQVELRSSLLDTPENREALIHPDIFHSEKGREIYYYPSGLYPEVVEDYLEGLSLPALLERLGLQDEAQLEAIRGLLRDPEDAH